MASEQKQKDGGPAFPGFEHYVAMREDSKGPVQVVTGQPHGGISVRDYFAGQALQGIMANPEPIGGQTNYTVGEVPAAIARAAYQQADAMLVERSKAGA